MKLIYKEQSYKRWKRGEFGNRLRFWTLEEFRKAPFSHQVTMRYRGGVPGMFCRYDVDPSEVEDTAALWIRQGAEEHRIELNESSPISRMAVQGEYRNEPPFDFLYSTAKLHMRDALKLHPMNTAGLAAQLILKHAMSPSSWEDFEALLEAYPDHVLEVSVYECDLGNIPGRNALVWEVRSY